MALVQVFPGFVGAINSGSGVVLCVLASECPLDLVIEVVWLIGVWSESVSRCVARIALGAFSTTSCQQYVRHLSGPECSVFVSYRDNPSPALPIEFGGVSFRTGGFDSDFFNRRIRSRGFFSWLIAWRNSGKTSEAGRERVNGEEKGGMTPM